ncbi:MAG: hypothetical protein MUF05_07570 [Candidatus Omnitrophica bacterium]|jgi:tetratricopeptide (TPR) repeat protein|nr:hypothetical protein [Candidatus Omnitrophota bacterium]
MKKYLLILSFMFIAPLGLIFAQDKSANLQQSIERSLQNALSDNLRLSGENQDLKKKLKELEDYSRTITSLNSAMRDESKKLNSRIDGLDAVVSQAQAAQKKASFLEEENHNLKVDLKATQSWLDKLKLENQQLTTKLEANFLEQQNKQLIEKLQKKNKELEIASLQLSRFLAEKEAILREAALARYNLGVAFFGQRKFSDAAREFERSLELNAVNPDACYNLGIIYDEYLKDDQKAIDCYQKYLSQVKDDSGKDAVNKVQAKLLQAKLRTRGKVNSPVDQTIR